MTITAPAIKARALAPEAGSISGTPAKAATEDPTASNINAVNILIGFSSDISRMLAIGKNKNNEIYYKDPMPSVRILDA
jgi:hypothetical protein